MSKSKTSIAVMIGVRSGRIGIAVWLLAAASVPTTQAQAADKIREVNIGGYLSVAHSQAPASFNVGFPFYTAAWPLVEKLRSTK